MDNSNTPEPRLSPSEKMTLKHVAEAELLEREMDWVAIQRLKGWDLLEEGETRLKLTQAGRDALRPHGAVNGPSSASSRVKTVQGAAMPRSTCSPSGTSGAVVSAATAPEISTERPSGRHSPSSRLTRLTAGPMAVKSSRSAAPILPHNISPKCSATPKGSGGSCCACRAISRWVMPARAAAPAPHAAP